MKAVVVHGANDLRVDERPDPVPGAGEVLIAMEWGGVCGSDLASYAERLRAAGVPTEACVYRGERSAVLET